MVALVGLFRQSALAETLLTYATVKEASKTSITVNLGTRFQTATITEKTHAYRKMAVATPSEFPAGERVRVRIKLDGKEPTLREIMDAESEKWIERIRRQYIRAEVTAQQSGKLSVKLDDDSEFTYRITPTTKIDQNGLPVPANSLVIGTVLWVKGKGLSSLDTQLAHATDAPPAVAPAVSNPASDKGTTPKTRAATATNKGDSRSTKSATSKTTKSSPSNRLPFTNTADGTVDLILSHLGKLDLKVGGRLSHFEWTPRTQFFIGESRTTWEDLSIGLPVTVYYYRDGLGRLILSRVQMP